MIRGDAVEAVAMDYEIALSGSGAVDVLLGELDFPEGKRQKTFEDFIVISAQIDHLGLIALGHFEHLADETAVAVTPFSTSA